MIFMIGEKKDVFHSIEDLYQEVMMDISIT